MNSCRASTPFLKAGPLPNWTGGNSGRSPSGGRKSPNLLQGMDIREALGRVLAIPSRAAKTSRQRGTAVHDALEFLLSCSTMEDRLKVATGIMKHTLEVEAHADLVAAVELLDHYEAEVLYVEALVWHVPEDRTPDTVIYAGTPDLLLRMPAKGRFAKSVGWKSKRPIVAIADLKTGRSVWGDHGLAVSAYAKATHLVEPDGTVIPMPTIDKALALHCYEGVGEAQEIVDIDEGFRQFLSAATVWIDHKYRYQDLLAPIPEMGKVGKRTGVGGQREGLRKRLNYYLQKGAPKSKLMEILPAPLSVISSEQITEAHKMLTEHWEHSAQDAASANGADVDKEPIESLKARALESAQ